MMGHATGMDKYYRNMKPEDLADEYKKYMYNLIIFERKPDISGINEDLKAKDEEIRKLKEDMRILELTLQGIKNQLDIEKIKNGKK